MPVCADDRSNLIPYNTHLIITTPGGLQRKSVFWLVMPALWVASLCFQLLQRVLGDPVFCNWCGK